MVIYFILFASRSWKFIFLSNSLRHKTTKKRQDTGLGFMTLIANMNCEKKYDRQQSYFIIDVVIDWLSLININSMQQNKNLFGCHKYRWRANSISISFQYAIGQL